jgi:hypothetical protein
MYEVTRIGSGADPFSLSRRPLQIQNCNNPPHWIPSSTRIPTSRYLLEPRKSLFAFIHGSPPHSPIPHNESVFTTDPHSWSSDHFNRDFIPFSLPTPIGRPVPVINPDVDSPPKPHWFCDVPSSSLRPEPKVYLSEAANPVFSKPLPECCSCHTQLSFPFMASLKFNICFECISEGKLPIQTTTLDFFRVNSPEVPSDWTLADTNRLLSLIADHGDDWSEIANLLKSHTPAECLLHFLRLPMYDQYYIGDPGAVPEGEVPTNPKMLPFMIAPDPIAAYVEFVNAVDRRLGNVIAEEAQKRIQGIIAEKSGTMVFNQVPTILTDLLTLTGQTAANLAREECVKMLITMRDVLRQLDQEVAAQFRDFENGVREVQQHANKAPVTEENEEAF